MYALWGAECDLVELNTSALERSKVLFEKFECLSECNRFFKGSVLSLSGIDGLKEKYDFVSCIGVLHHTADKILGLCNLADRVADGGFLIIAHGSLFGGFQ